MKLFFFIQKKMYLFFKKIYNKSYFCYSHAKINFKNIVKLIFKN